MKAIQVYLTFPGNCGEAMTFYQSCFGGELQLMKVKDSPMAAQWPADKQEHILHSHLYSDGLVLMASDMPVPGSKLEGSTISPALVCSNEQEIRAYYEKLARGGDAIQPLHPFFAGLIGVLKDKFGVSWMFNCPKENY